MLRIENLNVHYADFHVLHDVSMEIGDGEAVGLVGANGHGKSTLQKAICGLIPSTSGNISLDGRNITTADASERVAEGLVYVAEDRHLFPDMTVEENLKLGAYLPRAQKRYAEQLELVFSLYPRLEERRKQSAGSLSGGEAQMCALGRGLMSSARFMAIDEPSLGLAPNLVDAMLRTIEQINKSGVTLFIVEQNLQLIQDFVNRIYSLEEGKIVSQRSTREPQEEEPV